MYIQTIRIKSMVKGTLTYRICLIKPGVVTKNKTIINIYNNICILKALIGNEH